MYYRENFKPINKAVHLLNADDVLEIEKAKKKICRKQYQNQIWFLFM